MIFTPADLDVLARTIRGEAANQQFPGQIAVGWVVRNRFARPQRFGMSIAAVCLARLQFSCWNRDDPNFVRIVTASVPDQVFVKALAAAAMVLTDSAPDPTFGADHYHTVDRPRTAAQWPPVWASGMHRTAIIEDHIFYKERV